MSAAARDAHNFLSKYKPGGPRPVLVHRDGLGGGHGSGAVVDDTELDPLRLLMNDDITDGIGYAPKVERLG